MERGAAHKKGRIERGTEHKEGNGVEFIMKARMQKDAEREREAELKRRKWVQKSAKDATRKKRGS